MDLNFKDVATILFATITAGVSLYNFRASRFRGKLKDDLDILKRYREEFGTGTSEKHVKIYNCLNEKIEHRMYKSYVLRRTDMSNIITGLAFTCAAFLPWTINNSFDYKLKIGLSLLLAFVAGYFFREGVKKRGKEWYTVAKNKEIEKNEVNFFN